MICILKTNYLYLEQLQQVAETDLPVEITRLQVAGHHVVAGGQPEWRTSSTVHNHHAPVYSSPVNNKPEPLFCVLWVGIQVIFLDPDIATLSSPFPDLKTFHPTGLSLWLKTPFNHSAPH